MKSTKEEKTIIAAKHPSLKTYNVYMEGYVTNGSVSPARFVGTGTGENFIEAAKDACIKAYSEAETNRYFNVRNDVPSYWGCRLYDNMTDASKLFG